MAIDPVFQWGVALTAAALWFAAGLGKLRSRADFARVLGAYQLLPQRNLPLAALLLPTIELLVGCLLLVPMTQAKAGLASSALFLLYGGAIGINLLRGRTTIDCGCRFGEHHQISWYLVTRNVTFAAATATLALAGIPRQPEPMEFALLIVSLSFGALTLMTLNTMKRSATH